MDFYDYLEETLRQDLKTAFEGMYKYGGNDMDRYYDYTKHAYDTLKDLSMVVSIDEFKVLKHQYYCAIYDGEWEDATKTESEEI